MCRGMIVEIRHTCRGMIVLDVILISVPQSQSRPYGGLSSGGADCLGLLPFCGENTRWRKS